MSLEVIERVAAVVALLGLPAWITWGNWRAKQRENRASEIAEKRDDILAWGERLQSEIAEVKQELKDLRAEVAILQRVFRSAVNFIDRIGLWFTGGMHGQAPHPPEALHEHIDTSLWERRAGPPDDGQPRNIENLDPNLPPP